MEVAGSSEDEKSRGAILSGTQNILDFKLMKCEEYMDKETENKTENLVDITSRAKEKMTKLLAENPSENPLFRLYIKGYG